VPVNPWSRLVTRIYPIDPWGGLLASSEGWSRAVRDARAAMIIHWERGEDPTDTLATYLGEWERVQAILTEWDRRAYLERGHFLLGRIAASLGL
jgi:hypothetical protein